MEGKTLEIKQAKNGYTIRLSYCEKKGGLSGYHSEEFIATTLPLVVEDMFKGKFEGKVSTPKDREKSYDKAAEKAMDTIDEDEKE